MLFHSVVFQANIHVPSVRSKIHLVLSMVNFIEGINCLKKETRTRTKHAVFSSEILADLTALYGS